MAVTRERLIKDYEWELDAATRWKSQGRTIIAQGTAGKELTRGRLEVPIEEYITEIMGCLKALRNGADPEAYNY